MLRTLTDHLHEVTGKRVLVRCNFDVPIEDGRVGDTTRIEDCGETIKTLLDHGCQIILIAHTGRPEGRPKPELSLLPVVPILERMLGETVGFAKDLREVKDLPARLVLLENVRFWPGEEANDGEFVKQLADLGDIYVNEAFANCHREHASIVGLAKALPSYAGLHLTQEIKVLDQIRHRPEHPFVVVLGGAKLETKEPLVEAFKDKADTILVGGRIAADMREKHSQLTEKIMLAEMGTHLKDVTETSARRFAEQIMAAKTVLWNGTMGVFEKAEYQLGTRIVAEAVNKTEAFTVVGGGDTETALTELDLEMGIDHISTGGGAMLEFFAKGTLPGIEVLGYGED